MRKANIVITAFLCFGLALFVLGKTGYATKITPHDLYEGYDAVISYGGYVSFTATPDDVPCYLVWVWGGTPVSPITYGYSSIWGNGPFYAQGGFSVTCEFYYTGGGGGYQPDITYAQLKAYVPLSGSQTFTWLVLPPPTPTPTPYYPTPTPTPYYPTPTPSPTSSPSPTPTPTYPTPTPTYPIPTPSPTPTPTPTTYYTVTTTVSPTGKGQAAISPSGSSSFASGSTVTLTGTPISGWQFDHWQETSPYYGALYTNPLSFSIDTNYAFTAVFTQLPTPTPTPSPSPSASPSGSPNPNPTLTPTPSPSPTPSPTLPPPPVTPPPATPTPSPSTGGLNLDILLQYTGLAMAIIAFISYFPANPKWLTKR